MHARKLKGKITLPIAIPLGFGIDSTISLHELFNSLELRQILNLASNFKMYNKSTKQEHYNLII